jgi:hypothetical protein
MQGALGRRESQPAPGRSDPQKGGGREGGATRIQATLLSAGSVEVLEGSGAGWNGERMHHIDAHRLDDGSWIACVDGYGVT